jgi:hypothetical protein
MNRNELKAKLDNASVLTDVSESRDMEALQDLLKHPGLPILYGLMLGTRQAYYAALANAPLTNMETVAVAARTQGIISGIELFGNTLIEQAVPSPESKEQ